MATSVTSTAAVAANSDRVAFAMKLAESLQNDLKSLSNEARRKYLPVKEAAESGIVKIRNIMAKNQDVMQAMQQDCAELLQPFILGCDTKNSKLVQISVNGIQRLIAHGAMSTIAAEKVVGCLWHLMEIGVEEVKLLQTILLLLNNGNQVRGQALSKALVLCLRLHDVKDSTTVNAASATVRQLVSLVFERVSEEDKTSEQANVEAFSLEELKVCHSTPPKSLASCAADAYMLFQDLVQLVNTDRPVWLLELNEVSRTFGLELLEEVLTSFGDVFIKHPELSFLLKERVCPLIIKLFSPNVKHRNTSATSSSLGSMGSSSLNSASNSASNSSPAEKPCFPITVRLLRIVSVLIHKYHSLLVTECEIFLSLVVKFLDVERPSWQRALALGVLHRMVVQPQLIRSFCQCYDSKPHSTKILQDIVNALGAYVQSLFVSSVPSGQSMMVTQTQVQGSPPSLLGGLPMGPGISPQPAFYYHGVWIPLAFTFSAGKAKSIYLDYLDKSEVGPLPEGYGISIAYACLLDVVRSVCLAVEGTTPTDEDGDTTSPPIPTVGSDLDDSEIVLQQQLVESTWCGLLAALCLLLEASTDESASENILKAMQSYARLSGSMNLTTPRDAFVTALCKASLPPYYTLTILSEGSNGSEGTPGSLTVASMQAAGMTSASMASAPPPSAAHLAQYLTESEYRPQVVAVGTPLPTSSLQSSGNQGSVMLTAKNLQCMRSILVLAHCHGSILGTAWHMVLTTLQHLVWILGLKPSTGGSLKAGRTNDSNNTVITTAVMADLPVLSAMLSRLFESSQYLDDVALHHLVDALCRLSQESMELAYSNREPSLFAVAKLLETGLVNLPRLKVLWRPLTNHLLEVCRHPHMKMREWGVEAVTTLVKEAFTRRLKQKKGTVEVSVGDPAPAASTVTDGDQSTEEERHRSTLRLMVLAPLRELSDIPHPDVRQKQLDCVLQILHGNGDTLADGWPCILEVIGAISDNHGENLVRMAFQCLQLVVTDFLPTMPSSCLRLCVDSVARFGSQSQELNVSLSAIGLLWNVADHFHQNQERICQNLTANASDDLVAAAALSGSSANPNPVSDAIKHLPPFERLWMGLYLWLADLCVDTRPAVRKSAGQTLFSTIGAHGGILLHNTWQAVVWQVLFPLLDRVRSLSDSASSDKMDLGGNILIHHSRNTAQKQWAETQVLVLSGVAKVFAINRELLQTLSDFPRAWALLLEFIESGALGKNDEVSLAALKSFQEILQIGKNETDGLVSKADEITMWSTAWKIWHKIGTEVAKMAKAGAANAYIPSQAFLTAMLQIFPPLFRLVRPRFVASDLQKFATVVTEAVAIPIHTESLPAFLLPSVSDATLTPLQESALQAVDILIQSALNKEGGNLWTAIPQLISLLLTFSEYACKGPKPFVDGNGSTANQKTAYWVGATYVPFAERSLETAVSLYSKTAESPYVIQSGVFRDIVKTLRLPLSMKYSCPSQSTWKLAILSLLTVLAIGLPVARKNEKDFVASWSELALALEEFLFPKSPPPNTRTLEESQNDEAIDCKVVQVIRTEILAHSSSMPKEFILKVVSLLDRGSIHSATGSLSIEPETHSRLREEFARLCFETLLQYSFLHAGGRHPGRVARAETDVSGATLDGSAGVTGKLAVAALLHRFKEVIAKYVEDERLGGKCPLPRHRTSEMSFVLKAVSTLTAALKKAPSGTVSSEVWQQLIDLYPHLVDCSTLTSTQVGRALKEALTEYYALLKVPTKDANCVSNGL